MRMGCYFCACVGLWLMRMTFDFLFLLVLMTVR